jgi:hypothetical protein
MSADQAGIDATFHRPSGTVVVTVRDRAFDGGGGGLDDAATLADKPDVKRVVIDLRAVESLGRAGFKWFEMLLYRLAPDKRLTLVTDRPRVREAFRLALSAALADLVRDPAELRERHGIDLDLLGPDDPVSFTADELREMEAEGLTLGAAIRALETRPG